MQNEKIGSSCERISDGETGSPRSKLRATCRTCAAVSRRVQNLFAICKTKKSVRLASRYKCNIPKVFAHIGLINPSKQHMRTYFGSECRILRSVRSGSGRHKVILCRPENAADSSKDIADAETVRRAERADFIMTRGIMRHHSRSGSGYL